MSGIEILLAVIVLLVVPVLAGRRQLEPSRLARASIVSLLSSFVIVITTLGVCATALINGGSGSGAVQDSGLSARHLVPSSPAAGWISLGIIFIIVVRAGGSLVVAHRRRHTLIEQLRYADRIDIDNVSVATLPTDAFFAAWVPGPNGCVVVSSGAMRRLERAEIRAVVHHEEAHRLHGHHRHLLCARAAARSLWFVPGIIWATRALRTSIELAADADACEAVDRASVKSALLATSSPHDDAAVCRLDGLSAAPRRTVRRFPLISTVVLITVIAVAIEMRWLGVLPS